MKKKTASYLPSIGHLKEISHWISSVYNLDQLLELLTVSATQMMKAKASSLLLLDERRNKLFFKVATGEKKDDIKKFEIELGKGIVGHVAQTGEPLLIEDVNKDPRWYREISESVGFDTHSIVCVPMVLEGKTIGVIEVIDRQNHQAFDTNDIGLLSVFADLSALAISKAQQFEKVERENRTLKEALECKYQIIGESPAIRRAISDAFKVANANSSTLITGESGTGKELLARLIHRGGARKNNTLVVINCAALPETLLEDELFGHEKGAFTGAVDKKVGKFELADGGTLFLDEICEMNPNMQAKLLRVIQEGQFYRIGGLVPISVDVRIISATNKNVEQEVKEGRFREDLYYRLNVVHIKIPSLRERKEDITILAQHFLNLFKQERGIPNLDISASAMTLLTSYQWPGNVRELKNAIERAVVMGNGIQIMPADLPISNPSDIKTDFVQASTLEEAVHQFKKSLIEKTLISLGGKRTNAARKLGIQRTYLSRLIKRYNIKIGT
jgi:Nif-specific regulatory protein